MQSFAEPAVQNFISNWADIMGKDVRPATLKILRMHDSVHTAAQGYNITILHLNTLASRHKEKGKKETTILNLSGGHELSGL